MPRCARQSAAVLKLSVVAGERVHLGRFFARKCYCWCVFTTFSLKCAKQCASTSVRRPSYGLPVKATISICTFSLSEFGDAKLFSDPANEPGAPGERGRVMENGETMPRSAAVPAVRTDRKEADMTLPILFRLPVGGTHGERGAEQHAGRYAARHGRPRCKRTGQDVCKARLTPVSSWIH